MEDFNGEGGPYPQIFKETWAYLKYIWYFCENSSKKPRSVFLVKRLERKSSTFNHIICIKFMESSITPNAANALWDWKLKNGVKSSQLWQFISPWKLAQMFQHFAQTSINSNKIQINAIIEETNILEQKIYFFESYIGEKKSLKLHWKWKIPNVISPLQLLQVQWIRINSNKFLLNQLQPPGTVLTNLIGKS